MANQIGIFLRLYYSPARAFGEILDKGSLAFAAVVAIAVSVALQSLSLLIPVAVLFVPAAVIIIAAWVGRGSAGVALQRDYAPMLACTLMAWAAAHLPIVPFMYAAPQYMMWARIVAAAYFAVLAAIAIQTVAGARFLQSAVTAVGSIAAAVGGYFAWGQLGGLPYMFMSPFILIWLYPMIRANVDSVSGGLRSRQNFRRTLEAATLNPRDADAHYQLGLIYQDRRNFTEAMARFQKAVEIDPSDPAAHYQLGRIAREQGRVQDALAHLTEAYRIDPKHSSNEVLRDLGATNLELGKTELALQQLEVYVDRREYDPQGQYWLGRAYKAVNLPAEAKAAFARAIDAAQTAPPHLKRQAAKWIGQSRSEMKAIP
jgi:tetratricopeptide (TPR) repeat protein